MITLLLLKHLHARWRADAFTTHDLDARRQEYLARADALRKEKEQTKMERLILSLHDGTPVKLVGYNEDMLRQITVNRILWRVYRKLGWNLVPSVLMVHVEVFGVEYLLDSAAIVVRFFAPQTHAEKWAVAEAEAAVLYTQYHKDDVIDNARRLAYANELIWMAVTGQISGEEVVERHIPQTYNRHIETIATWNTSEPTLGLGLYEGL